MQERVELSRKMVVFDMDNTLLRKRYIEECADHFKFKQALALLRQIDHDPVSLTKRIAWFLKDRKKKELLEIGESIPLVDDIVEVANQLKKRNYTIGIISDSYQIITQMVAEKINADFELSNELQFLGDLATGDVLIPSYFHYSAESTCKHQVCKTNALRHICRAYNTKLENCIMVGDSDNDICILKHSGIGVSFCTTSELVKQAAQQHITSPSFAELLSIAE